MANTIPDQLINRLHQQQQMMLSPAELENILRESKHRWLRPSEILQILSNYNVFKLSTEPPHLPPAGSLFLFNRKALRYFRRDGHNWKKKKDGKTVREAHEKLKVGSVDALHCYYAHGEDNENFQRRCYWMLDEKVDHIVLVHYREVRERYKFNASPVPVDQVENLQPSSAASFAQPASPSSAIEKAYTVPQNKADWKRETLSHDASLFASDTKGFCFPPGNPSGSRSSGVKSEKGTGSSLWLETCCSNKREAGLLDQRTGFVISDMADRAILVAPSAQSDLGPAAATKEAPQSAVPFTYMNESHHHSELQMVVASSGQAGKWKDDADNSDLGNLKKLDSFGRWMNKEIGQDCDDSLILSDSGNYWDTLAAENEEREVSSLSHHMQLDIDSLGPSLSQVQLFTIHDFTPEWGYTGVETKVLIVGTFLEKPKPDKETRWACMFGEIEVSAEILNGNAIRCHAPIHAIGNVPFYVTCRDRLACSEVREFQYRENPIKISSLSERSVQQLELCFQVRLAKLSSLDIERKWVNCSVERCNACKLRSTIASVRSNSRKEQDWGVEKWMTTEECIATRDILLQRFMTEKLCEWLLCKAHEGGRGPDILDDEGQGVLHLASGLGYYWVVGLLVEASGNPNFRDAQGRTALHWASYFGREETVVALVRLGVDPTAVDDPTPSFPGGRTAADVASVQGHKGIAGYLAEAYLTRQLCSLSNKREVVDSEDATTAAENARMAAQVSVPLNLAAGEQLSLKQSLAAVRKSAHAAALIQAMYREKKSLVGLGSSQNTRTDDDDELHEVSRELAALGVLKHRQKRNHIQFEDYFHSAAVKIQKKYRGWKGRKDFLMIRERVVKIQAHVRGHQVRRNYKKVVWSVSIVEKAILRWRRKRVGLRGFLAKEMERCGGEVLGGDTDEYEFLITGRQQKSAGVEKALARVTSMVRHPEARDQYLRLVTKFETLKLREGSNSVMEKGDTGRKFRIR